MLCHVAFFALLGYLHLWSVSAEVITVGAEDPRVLLDASFWLDASVSGCNITYWSDTPRATAIFNFTGTAVTVIGPYSGRGGVSEVYIDDKLAGTIDRYEATSKSRCDIKAFEKTGLSFTQHTLKLVLVGNSTEWDSTVFNPGTISLSEIQ
ncbi:hypothetical protein FRC03_009581 [Tulasnella sp. 419]|nr:hypothetical protein FRC03_009581 [Tulasnella sp. 419]